ncbi:hypothetical protein D3C72_2078210 [compost metagenome]
MKGEERLLVFLLRHALALLLVRLFVEAVSRAWFAGRLRLAPVAAVALPFSLGHDLPPLTYRCLEGPVMHLQTWGYRLHARWRLVSTIGTKSGEILMPIRFPVATLAGRRPEFG